MTVAAAVQAPKANDSHQSSLEVGDLERRLKPRPLSLAQRRVAAVKSGPHGAEPTRGRLQRPQISVCSDISRASSTLMPRCWSPTQDDFLAVCAGRTGPVGHALARLLWSLPRVLLRDLRLHYNHAWPVPAEGADYWALARSVGQ